MKLTHAQARMEQHLYWSSKTVMERLTASRALTRRMYLMRGIDIDELKPDLTLAAFLANVEYGRCLET